MDWDKLLRAMVPLGVALARPGQSGASFVQGFQGADQMMWERRQQEEETARRNTMAQAEMANREHDNQRQDQMARLNRLAMALQQLQPAVDQQADYATDPTQAESSLLQRTHQLESSFELPPAVLAGYVPPMAPMISARKIKRAKAKMAELQKLYGDKLGDVADSLTIHEGEFAGTSVRELLSMAEMEPPPKSTPRSRPEAAAGSFEDYVARYAKQLGKAVDDLSAGDVEAARKRYQQADDRPQTGATVIVHTVDAEGNPVTRIVPKTPGAEFAAPPPAAEQTKRAARALVTQSITAVKGIGDKIIRRVGPAQRAEAIKRGVDAVFGNDPAFRTYQDARTALAGNLAVAQQGSRPSDADIRAIWLPLVPDAYRDTADSARMKWDLIQQMMGTAPAQASELPPGVTVTRVPN